MPADPTSSQTVVAKERSVFVYRCVCGESVSVDPRKGTQCPQCGRHISPAAIQQEGPATVQMLDSRGSHEIRADKSSGNGSSDAGSSAGETTATTESLIGQRLGYFRILSSIGRGGMGTVYRALDESLQRYVALKVIHAPDSSLAGGSVQHLLQEARAQARVHHPNVVTIYYVGKQKETPFLAMELASGNTLADRMQQGPVPFGEMIAVAVQVASALRMAAQLDMVHGDIKPGNILIMSDGTVKLSDFGLARRISPSAGPSTKISGTPSYLSPEACQGRPTDSRADMYALGVLLFEMTFRRHPYTLLDSSLQDCLYAHVKAPPEFPDLWPADLPERWKDILARLLAKDPDDRYATYDELIRDLESVRPIELPKSGRLVRALAWVVDLLLVFAVQSLLYSPFIQDTTRGIMGTSRPVRIVAGALAALAPLAFAWLQVRWRTSPGKKLFQVRIVDRYGLAPGEGVLFSRAFVQVAPLWIMAIMPVTTAINAGLLGRFAGVIVMLALLADAVTAFIRKDGRALHDLFFGTRVVLDAPQPGASSGKRVLSAFNAE